MQKSSILTPSECSDCTIFVCGKKLAHAESFLVGKQITSLCGRGSFVIRTKKMLFQNTDTFGCGLKSIKNTAVIHFVSLRTIQS